MHVQIETVAELAHEIIRALALETEEQRAEFELGKARREAGRRVPL